MMCVYREYTARQVFQCLDVLITLPRPLLLPDIFTLLLLRIFVSRKKPI